MADRDDFTEATKRYVALRAGHECSFPGCRQRTVGPGDESPTSFTNIGEAAHICAAALGGRRYVESMSPEERVHISNAIWLCATHARLIDRDSATYTIDQLRRMKRDHEAACAEQVRRSATGSTQAYDLIAIGPDIICTAEISEISTAEWSFRLLDFVNGDFGALVAFIGRFGSADNDARYVLANELGDGRVLTGAPTVARNSSGYLLRCPIAPGCPRIAAQELGTSLALSTLTNDIFAENGEVARVSGLASLPQHIMTSLSLQRGESPFYPSFGVRFAEYLDAFRDSPWLGHLLKLEVIHQASIPRHDQVLDMEYTPLRCIERVHSIEILAEAPTNKRLPIRGDFEVKGVGRWQCEVAIFIPPAGWQSPARGPEWTQVISAIKQS